jgi:hypothetical protein
MVFNATFSNLSVISWRSVLWVEETGVPGENHRPAASHWQILSYNVVSSANVWNRPSWMCGILSLNVNGKYMIRSDIHNLQTLNYSVKVHHLYSETWNWMKGLDILLFRFWFILYNLILVMNIIAETWQIYVILNKCSSSTCINLSYHKVLYTVVQTLPMASDSNEFYIQ